ncbi:hypothetical protein SynMITS9220_01754 [Synechococcus sp. MIT S9220]|nr:hypothetical protein SynMITS9220_01754 [Synechococcus sp. MIT S9220]
MIVLDSGGHPSWTSSPSPESIGFTSPIRVVFQPTASVDGRKDFLADF